MSKHHNDQMSQILGFNGQFSPKIFKGITPNDNW